MKRSFLKCMFLCLAVCFTANYAMAQKKVPRKSVKRTSGSKTKANIEASVPSADNNPVVAAVAPAEAPKVDSLPIPVIKRSLRPDEAVETSTLKDRIPLPYEHLRADDAVYRHRIWREIDTREKMNQPFMYDATTDNGNQRFISILLQALQDSTNGLTAFSNVDDRFTTPMTNGEVAKVVLGDEIDVPD